MPGRTRANVRLSFIRPGKPNENAYIESFNGKFRDECLNEHWFVTMAHARRVIESLAHRVQHRAPAQLARRSHPGGVRRATYRSSVEEALSLTADSNPRPD